MAEIKTEITITLDDVELKKAIIYYLSSVGIKPEEYNTVRTPYPALVIFK